MTQAPADLKLTKQEENRLFVLDTIIHCMMVRESFDYIENDNPKKVAFYFKGNFKTKTKELKKILEPIITRDYALVHANGEDTTNKIITDFEIFVRYIGLTRLPSKEEIQNLSKAYNQNPKLLGSISKKVIVGTFKNDKPSEVLSKEQNNLLRLLDYAVNLVFLEKYLFKIEETNYDIYKITTLIKSILKEVKGIINKNYQLLSKEPPKADMIEFYRDFVEFLGDIKIYEKIAIAQLIESWNNDQKAMQGAVNKTLKLN